MLPADMMWFVAVVFLIVLSPFWLWPLMMAVPRRLRTSWLALLLATELIGWFYLRFLPVEAAAMGHVQLIAAGAWMLGMWLLFVSTIGWGLGAANDQGNQNGFGLIDATNAPKAT